MHGQLDAVTGGVLEVGELIWRVQVYLREDERIALAQPHVVLYGEGPILVVFEALVVAYKVNHVRLGVSEASEDLMRAYNLICFLVIILP